MSFLDFCCLNLKRSLYVLYITQFFGATPELVLSCCSNIWCTFLFLVIPLTLVKFFVFYLLPKFLVEVSVCVYTRCSITASTDLSLCFFFGWGWDFPQSNQCYVWSFVLILILFLIRTFCVVVNTCLFQVLLVKEFNYLC